MKRRIAILVFFFSISLNIIFLLQTYLRNVVVSVPDGDSLQMRDGRRVRLLGIDAPEKNRCMADEARSALASIAQNKHVMLRDIVTDDFGRQLAHVSIGRTDLNAFMVARGLARSSSGYKTMQDTAKTQKLGIWSDTCRKTSNPECDIKGNIKDGKKTYHLPTCDHYAITIIDTSFGDQWFCTEEEAVRAGFAIASRCITN